jgi:hypothetical protein
MDPKIYWRLSAFLSFFHVVNDYVIGDRNIVENTLIGSQAALISSPNAAI